MATITTTVKVWVNDETKDVFSEKEIKERKAEMIADWLADSDEKFEMFDNFCADELYPSEIIFATEEERAKILTRFDKYLEECADEVINEWYTDREIEVELEVNA
jgi:hypothetical protein